MPSDAHASTAGAGLQLAVAGTVLQSMPRMRKPWLRTCEVPEALRAAVRGPAAHSRRPRDDVPLSPAQQHASPVETDEADDLDDDAVSHVSPITMKELEDTFLRGLNEAEERRDAGWRDAGGAFGQDLSFLNDVGYQLHDAADSAGSARHNSENIPPLNLPKSSKPAKKTAPHANVESVHSHRHARSSKEELQPFLGAQLKKNLAKQGLVAQQLSLQPDEWDDDTVVNMLGTNFASREEVLVSFHHPAVLVRAMRARDTRMLGRPHRAIPSPELVAAVP